MTKAYLSYLNDWQFSESGLSCGIKTGRINARNDFGVVYRHTAQPLLIETGLIWTEFAELIDDWLSGSIFRWMADMEDLAIVVDISEIAIVSTQTTESGPNVRDQLRGSGRQTQELGGRRFRHLIIQNTLSLI